MHKGDGFTIIEVMLFLGITTLLLMMVLFGTGAMARENRFSDSINSFQAYVQKQYEDVLSGVNPRGSGQGCDATSLAGGDTCILLGKVMTFSTTTPFQGITRYIRTSNVSVPDTGDIFMQISQANPDVISAAEQPYVLQWGATVQVASRSTAPLLGEPIKTASSPARALINSVAFLRGPNSSRIVPYYFYAPSTDVATVNIGLKKAIELANAPATTQAKATICIHNTQDWSFNAPVAAIEIGGGRGTAGITSNFKPTTGSGGVCN